MQLEQNSPLWSEVLSRLKSDLGEQAFSKWIKPTRLVGVAGQEFTLEAPNGFIRDRLHSDFNPAIKQMIAEVYAHPEVALSIVVGAAEPVNHQALAGECRSSAEAEGLRSQPLAINERDREGDSSIDVPYEIPASRGLNRHYNFDSYVVGTTNQFAHAACQAVADAPGQHYNPLFIYGGVGLGKTHLLHAVGLKVQQKNPAARICYMTSEKFINDLINSLRLKRMDDFRRRYRSSCDLLLIDDIQFIAGKERSQEEFFHTFNTLYELKKQIILTSDKAPKEIPELEERLCSRFESGLIADIQAPELETRIAILRRKAEQNNIVIPDDVALFLAHSIRNNVRELEGSLIRLSAYSSLMGQQINLEFAQELFRDLIKEPRPISIDSIQRTVAKAFNIKSSDINSDRKPRYIALPRQISMYLARKLTPSSFPDIGKAFGGKDHTTVLHAVRKIEQLMGTDASIKNTIDSLEKTVRFGGTDCG